ARRRRHLRTVRRRAAGTDCERAGRDVIRRLGVCIALAGLLAGCGSRTAADRPAPVQTARGKARTVAQKRVHVVVTVIDRDTRRRVSGALVRAGRHTDRANRIGNAEIRLRRRVPLLVSVTAPGYAGGEVRLPFQRRRRFVLRVYREGLQWPMYGATLARTQA